PPAQLYGASRRNSAGRDLSIKEDREALVRARALLNDPAPTPAPAEAITTAQFAFKEWNAKGGAARGAILRAMADKLQAYHDPLAALIAREAGRGLQDCIDEVREAIDFCRYYAAEAERLFAGPHLLPSPAGESDHLELHGRGVFVCISPWNFPLAIFTGQLAAALAAGNTVAAKPAEQTPRIAELAVKLFQEAGLPKDVLQLVQGDGKVGGELVADPRIAGVAFTGSTEIARHINRTL